MPQNDNIFQAVNERYNIVEVARDLGIRIKKVASGYRADSIANNGQGENAFKVNPFSLIIPHKKPENKEHKQSAIYEVQKKRLSIKLIKLSFSEIFNA